VPCTGITTATSMAISLDGGIAFHPRHTPHRCGADIRQQVEIDKKR
jgi:hypothetical protein